MKIKLKIVVKQAHHFLKWEMPHFASEFELVENPAEDTVVLAFGPDVLEEAALMPAFKRVALLFPGFGFNPYHNSETKNTAVDLLKRSYNLILTNPGAIFEAFKADFNVVVHPFSIDVDSIFKFQRTRKTVENLVHISADSYQKDWERSAEIMALTKLPNEIFPPRGEKKVTLKSRIQWRYNKYIVKKLNPQKASLFFSGYTNHRTVMKKYRTYDGFVHIAAEKPHPLYLDGKYTASLLEAGATGAIVFWHDTFSLGNDFESVLSVDKEPSKAAEQIKQLIKSENIPHRSRLAQEEICDRCNPRQVVGLRKRAIENIL